MKKFEKSKFHFLNDDGTKKEPKEDDIYANVEWRYSKKFPFIRRYLVIYKLLDGVWIEKQSNFLVKK